MVTAAVGPDLVAEVEDRDGERCAICGRDCRELRERLEERLMHGWWPLSVPPTTAELVQRDRAWKWSRLLARLGMLSWSSPWTVRLWEVAFKAPGGAGVQLGDLRTICRPCRRRAEA